MFIFLAFVSIMCQACFSAELNVLEFLAKMQSQFSQSAVEDADIAEIFKNFNNTTSSNIPEVVSNKFATVNNDINIIAAGLTKVINFLKENQTKTLKIDSFIPDQLYSQVQHQLIKLQHSTKLITKSHELFIKFFVNNAKDFDVNSNGQFNLPAGVGLELLKIEMIFKNQSLHLKHECKKLGKSLLQVSSLIQPTDHMGSILFELTAVAFGKSGIVFDNIAKSIQQSIKELIALGLENTKQNLNISATKLMGLLGSELYVIGDQYAIKAEQANNTANALPSSSSSTSSETRKKSAALFSDWSTDLLKLSSLNLN